MLRRFLHDIRGNFAMMTAVAMVPIMGALALGVDYAEMSRQRQAAMQALDAAGIATARRISEGASDAEAIAYAENFFAANLGPVDPNNATLNVVLPSNEVGGGTLKMTAALTYRPYFYTPFQALMGLTGGDLTALLTFNAANEIRLKNTLEVALVLDNSGSMDYLGSGSGEKRIDLLKKAAKQLVDTIAGQAAMMKQIEKPVQFGLVPFAASVNVGPDNATASWMDTDGISPIHHENFDWNSMSGGDKRVEQVGGVYYKKGGGWDDEENQKVTRFTLFDDLTRSVCVETRSNGRCKTYEYRSFASWQGCVEMRPHPYGLDDTKPASAKPATLFVPMFAPDETDTRDRNGRPANNNWWPDDMNGSAAERQAYMPKYFEPAEKAAMGLNEGPNASCGTKPITPLVDVSKEAGLTKIKDAIDAMTPNGATNVPEGMAWGWRVVSSTEPFTQGRKESEKGNDKVVIVLTDGANTYYTPGSIVANEYSGSGHRSGGNDLAEAKSTYSTYGYARNRKGESRILSGTTSGVSSSDYSNENYTKAMNDHMSQLCDNAKNAGLIVMTVALDLDDEDRTEKAQIDALRKCASDSRFRKDPDDPTKPAKLFWNATGANLADKFKEIADELSNLRIVG